MSAYTVPLTAKAADLEARERLRTRNILPCPNGAWAPCGVPRCGCAVCRRYACACDQQRRFRRVRASTISGLASASTGQPRRAGEAAAAVYGYHLDGRSRRAVDMARARWDRRDEYAATDNA
jgi:hypothetical protein